MLHVHILLGDDIEEGVDHMGHIVMDDADTRLTGAFEVNVRQVHGVFRGTVHQIIRQLLRGHHGAFFLALRRGSAQVRICHDAFRADDLFIGKVRHITGDLARGQGGQHRVGIHKAAAGQVNDPHAVLHLAEGVRPQHAAGLVCQVQLDEDIIGIAVDGAQVLRVAHFAGDAPGRFHGHIRIVTDDVHPQGQRGVGDTGADVPQADDTQGLAHDLRAYIVFLSLLDGLLGILPAGQGLGPQDALCQIAGSKDQRADCKLHHRLGVGAGGVEHHDALLRAALDGDVIHAHARAPDSQQVFAELGIMQPGRTDEKRAGILGVHIQDEVLGGQHVQPCLGDIVHGFNYIHSGFTSSVYFTKPLYHEARRFDIFKSPKAAARLCRKFGYSAQTHADTAFR